MLHPAIQAFKHTTHEAQEQLFAEHGGLRAIMAGGLAPFSAVPKGYGMDDGRTAKRRHDIAALRH